MRYRECQKQQNTCLNSQESTKPEKPAQSGFLLYLKNASKRSPCNWTKNYLIPRKSDQNNLIKLPPVCCHSPGGGLAPNHRSKHLGAL